jgi:putative cell wall-binding protein
MTKSSSASLPAALAAIVALTMSLLLPVSAASATELAPPVTAATDVPAPVSTDAPTSIPTETAVPDPAPISEEATEADALEASAALATPGVSRARYSGSDRYEVAVSIAHEWPAGVPVVYLAAGAKFADALSAGPAAVKQGGPLLLTKADALPASVADELRRLAPQRVVIVGGEASVSGAVFTAVQSAVPAAEVERLGGADRYEVSRAVVDDAFGASGAPLLYVATGVTFPDALSASPAASTAGGAVLLVNGWEPGLDGRSVALAQKLRPSQIVIAGGTVSVPISVESAFTAVAPTVRRGGENRYEVSVTLNSYAFPDADRVFFATGKTFADALSGGVLAGSVKSPLFVVPGACVTEAIRDRVQAYGAGTPIVFGGQASVSDAAARLEVCAPPPPPPAPPAPPAPQPPAPPAAPGNPGDSRNCSDFSDYASAKAWFDTYYPWYGDIAKLDQDNDGIPCESLRGAP